MEEEERCEVYGYIYELESVKTHTICGGGKRETTVLESGDSRLKVVFAADGKRVRFLIKYEGKKLHVTKDF